jgi:UDP-glucose 4-epimerase
MKALVTGANGFLASHNQHSLNFEPYMQVNVTGTYNALEASYKNHVKRFIFVSTANTIGYGTKSMGAVGSVAAKSGFKSDLNHINAKILCMGNYYSSTKAVNELQLPQTPVDDAIVDALEWFARVGYLKIEYQQL